MSKEFEVRAQHGVTLETREDGITRIVLMPIVVDDLSVDLGGFKERIHRTAIEKAIARRPDLRALVEHDPISILGRMSNGSLRVTIVDKGLLAEIDPPNTTVGKDTVELIRRGDLDGSSFRFRVAPGGSKMTMEDGMPVRNVMDMEIKEISVVAWPAYPTTTAEVRHQIDTFVDQRRGHNVEMARRRLSIL